MGSNAFDEEPGGMNEDGSEAEGIKADVRQGLRQSDRGDSER